VHLIVIDEAARVPDDLYRAVRPMLAKHSADSRLVCLSTPYGKRGFFYDAWRRGNEWKRIEVPATAIRRITPEFLEEEQRNLGVSWFRQEYCCSFEALEGLVYPDMARCVVQIGGAPGAPATCPAVPPGRKVGGIDFGFRNPLAAVWGVVDRDDILWLSGEHYERERPLSHHIQKVPRDVQWFADPAAAGEIAELRVAGFQVLSGVNAIRPGIAAVSARIQNGTLRIVQNACPNLLAEAELYRYATDAESRGAETPCDDHNHALDALRYLIARLDALKLGRKPNVTASGEEVKKKPWLRLDNEALWTRIW
jgi:hypothetical protein